MAKYSVAFKMAVVQAYLAGEGGYRTLADKFDISNYSTVLKWVKKYETLGDSGLMRKITHKAYSVQFKLDALHYKLRTGESYQDVAIKFGMQEPSIIANWFRTWQKEGVARLSKPKGRPTMSKKNNDQKNRGTFVPVSRCDS